MYNSEYPLEINLSQMIEINPTGKKISGIDPIEHDTHFEYQFDDDWVAFKNALDINTSELFKTKASNCIPKFLFRGHKNQEYLLTPTAFRNLDANKIGALKSGNGHSQAENSSFINFIKGMNSIGLKITAQSFDYINKSSNKNNSHSFFEYGGFAHGSSIQDLALAQHYGIPTRLLDFTFNPLIVLFFATESINYPPEDPNKKMSIWIIPDTLIDVVKETSFIDRVFVNGFQNQNMISQEGLFINYIQGRAEDENLYDDDSLIPLDQYLLSNLNSDQKELIAKKIGKPMKFTLSHSCEKEITLYLDSLNINWTTVQPDLEGVKKEVDRLSRKSNTTWI